MKKKTATATLDTELTKIKRLAVVAMVSDDDLLDTLVLKGGNAIDLIYGVNDRASIDIDFSIAKDLDREIALPKIKRALESVFKENGYMAFDIKMAGRPGEMPQSLAEFWGGYLVEFKLIQAERAHHLENDAEQMRPTGNRFWRRDQVYYRHQ